MISVVIPAHNEADVLGELLDALRSGIGDGRLEVVVVANGCSDTTAARAGGYPVIVLELEEGDKTSALNAGDAAVSAFPRFYVDADVVLTADDLGSLASALDGPVVAVAPARAIDASASSWPVRAYYRIWDRLDSTSRSLAGRGCYGVSEIGRGRWREFPDLIADDGYVNSLFAVEERANIASVCSVVTVPRDVRSLLRRKRRGHRGNVELEEIGVEVTSSLGWLAVIGRSPARFVDAPAYLAITLASRWLARRDLKRGITDWGSDQSSRGSK